MDGQAKDVSKVENESAINSEYFSLGQTLLSKTVKKGGISVSVRGIAVSTTSQSKPIGSAWKSEGRYDSANTIVRGPVDETSFPDLLCSGNREANSTGKRQCQTSENKREFVVESGDTSTTVSGENKPDYNKRLSDDVLGSLGKGDEVSWLGNGPKWRSSIPSSGRNGSGMGCDILGSHFLMPGMKGTYPLGFTNFIGKGVKYPPPPPPSTPYPTASQKLNTFKMGNRYKDAAVRRINSSTETQASAQLPQMTNVLSELPSSPKPTGDAIHSVWQTSMVNMEKEATSRSPKGAKYLPGNGSFRTFVDVTAQTFSDPQKSDDLKSTCQFKKQFAEQLTPPYHSLGESDKTKDKFPLDAAESTDRAQIVENKVEIGEPAVSAFMTNKDDKYTHRKSDDFVKQNEEISNISRLQPLEREQTSETVKSNEGKRSYDKSQLMRGKRFADQVKCRERSKYFDISKPNMRSGDRSGETGRPNEKSRQKDQPRHVEKSRSNEASKFATCSGFCDKELIEAQKTADQHKSDERTQYIDLLRPYEGRKLTNTIKYTGQAGPGNSMKLDETSKNDERGKQIRQDQDNNRKKMKSPKLNGVEDEKGRTFEDELWRPVERSDRGTFDRAHASRTDGSAETTSLMTDDPNRNKSTKVDREKGTKSSDYVSVGKVFGESVKVNKPKGHRNGRRRYQLKVGTAEKSNEGESPWRNI